METVAANAANGFTGWKVSAVAADCVLNSAVTRKKITHSPAGHIELAGGHYKRPVVWTRRRVEYWRRTGRRPAPVMVWLPEHAAAFLDDVADDDLYSLWRLITYSGVRRAGATGIIDIETLVRAADVIDGDDLPGPKSEAGARSISLDAGTIETLRAYRRRQAERRLALGVDWIDSGRFFTKPNGEAVDPAGVTQRFRHLVDRVGSGRVQCTGITKRGQRCARRIAGDSRCRQHGGSGQPRRRDGASHQSAYTTSATVRPRMPWRQVSPVAEMIIRAPGAADTAYA